MFPVKPGIWQTISLCELLMRWRLDYKKHCCVPPGTYCEVHDQPMPTKTMTSRIHKGIALGPTSNLQWSVKFNCINTGRVLKHCLYTPMPMPNRVIRRVNVIRQREGQGRTFRFLNQQKEPFKWTDMVLRTTLSSRVSSRMMKKPLHIPTSVLIFQEWNWRKRKENFRWSWTNRSLIFETWQRLPYTMRALVLMTECGPHGAYLQTQNTGAQL